MSFMNISEAQGVIDYKGHEGEDQMVAIEPKKDGWRFRSYRRDGVPKLFTRGGLEKSIPHIQRELSLLQPVGDFFDGEITHPLGFDAVGSAIAKKDERLHFHVFDIVDEDRFEADGVDRTPYYKRRMKLANIITMAYSEEEDTHVHLMPSKRAWVSEADDYAARCIEIGYEGCVIKKLDSPYRSGKTGDWVRIKASITVDAMIVCVNESKTMRGHAASVSVKESCGTISTVASGIQLKDKKVFFENRRTMEGLMMMEVEARGRTKNGLLRSASLVRLRPDKVNFNA